MAFPSIRSSAGTNGTTASATPVVNLPATIRAGDTLFVVFRIAVAGVVGWPTGWDAADPGDAAELFDASADAADDQFAAAWRKADGTEGATITLSCTSGKFAAIAYAVRDAADPAITPPQLSTVATGTSTTPNATTVTPTGGAKDYLWLTFTGREGEATVPPTYPTNYTVSQLTADSGVAGVVGTNVRVSGAVRTDLNAASEDAGTWTFSDAEDWTAYTIAFHPAVEVDVRLVGRQGRVGPSYPKVLYGLPMAAAASLALFFPPEPLPPGGQAAHQPRFPARFAAVGQTLPTDDAIPAIRPVDTGTGRPQYVRAAGRTWTLDGIREDAAAPEPLPPGTGDTPRARAVPALPRTWTLESLQDAVVAALPDGASETRRAPMAPPPPRAWVWAWSEPDLLPLGVIATSRPPIPPVVPRAWTRDGNAFAAPEAVPVGLGATERARLWPPGARTWTVTGNADAAPEPLPQGAGAFAGLPPRPAQSRTPTADSATTLLLQIAPPGAQATPAPAVARRAAPWAVPNPPLNPDADLPPGSLSTHRAVAPPPGRTLADLPLPLSTLAPPAEPLPPSPAPPGPPPRAPRYALVGDSRPGDDGTAPPTPLPDGASSNTQPVPPYAVVRGETANVLDLLVAPVAPMPPGVGSLDRPVRVRPYVPDALFWYIQEAEAPVGRSVPALPPTVRQRPLNVIDRPALVLDTPPAALPPGTSLAPAPRVLGPLVVAGHHVTARDVDPAAPTPLPPNTGVSIARPVAPRPAVIASYDVDLPEAAAPIIPDVPAPPQRPVRLSVSATGGVPPPDAAPAALPPFNATSTPRLSTPRPIGAATRNTLLLEPDVALPMGQAAWPYVRPRVALTPCVTGSPWLLDVAPVGATTQTRPTPSTRVATRTFTQDGLRRAFRAEWAQGANVVINRHRTTT